MKLDHSSDAPLRFAPAQIRALERRLREGGALRCMECASPLDVRPVRPRSDVAYVRDRVVVACALCHRSAVLDRREGR